MDTKEFIEWIRKQESTIKYQLLSRMKQDCLYFLGFGNRCEKHLWGGTAEKHIDFMRIVYAELEEKPEWLKASEIEQFSRDMIGK